MAALGLAGVGLAHVLEYLALVPDESDRARILADTGHHYLPSALSAVGFLALVAVAVAFLTAFRRGGGLGGRWAETAPDRWARLLPVAQVLAFVGLEVGERLVSGSSLSTIGPVIVLGLPLQLLAGVAGGRLLATLTRAGEQLGRALAGRLRPTVRRLGTCWRPVASASPEFTPSGAPSPRRGPPLLLTSV